MVPIVDSDSRALDGTGMCSGTYFLLVYVSFLNNMRNCLLHTGVDIPIDYPRRVVCRHPTISGAAALTKRHYVCSGVTSSGRFFSRSVSGFSQPKHEALAHLQTIQKIRRCKGR